MPRFLPLGKKREDKGDADNRDVARLFFDSFSKRVGVVEDNLRNVSSEFEKLKLSVDRGQISDLVLLERLQKAEQLIKESLGSIRVALEKNSAVRDDAGTGLSEAERRILSMDRQVETKVQNEAIIASHILSPTGELGSLPSITTPTELQVLTLLANEGPKSAPEIGRAVGRSREHTARLMKKLYEEGYIRRDQARIPFRYSLVDKVKGSFKKREIKDEGKEQISVPQT
jgi:predicted transcriptional regulator